MASCQKQPRHGFSLSKLPAVTQQAGGKVEGAAPSLPTCNMQSAMHSEPRTHVTMLEGEKRWQLLLGGLNTEGMSGIQRASGVQLRQKAQANFMD